ncbi:S1C family serine protease [Geomicrobium sediminis]|uniref:Serine protease Do n=1 Tax=Geomicrobium sediminis TaxID=1347788 RepID=A0ABS2PGC5_9BACL|nr:trypsin-like peptidase domain-containing protein [Geomicrobium sediminis]MBM7634489.1 serine protease Do [Geomicrobium sediminis]
MGFYDDHYSSRGRKSKSRKPIFLGVIIGAVLVLGIISVGQMMNLNGSAAEEEAETNQQEDEQFFASESETIDLDVTTDVTHVVDAVSDAVVGVFNLQNTSFWGGAAGQQEEGIEAGTGSGVIYKVEGDRAFVVTNEHVIQGSDELEVSLSEGQRVPAELVGSDIWTDLAVLTIDAENVDTVADFGNSDNLRAGEPAIAIGNPLGPRFARTVTLGIISATERSVPVDLTGDGQIDWNAEVLQTDAAINPGNSGGALLNIQSEVIGINSMKLAQGEGIGFAIPTTIVLPVIQDIEQYGEVRRPEMGVIIGSLEEIPSYHWQETLNLPPEIVTGVFIHEIIPNSPAADAGLEQYDVITALDGEDVEAAHDLRRHLYTDVDIGDEMEVTFYRNGEQMQTTVTLDEQQETM